MSVRVLAIQFNHDPISKSVSALNIRKNFYEPIALPEWTHDRGNSQDITPAAYAIDGLTEDSITIKVQFERLDASLSEIEVRAIHLDDPLTPWWLQYPLDPLQFSLPYNYFSSYLEYYQYLTYSYYSRLWLNLIMQKSNVLGEVKAKWIKFGPTEKTGMVTMGLQNVRLSSRGIDIHPVVWQWQYRLSATQPWINIDQTSHKIYSVLYSPTLPWVQQPFTRSNVALPWSEVLEFSCQWASGSMGLDAASQRITDAVYSLGDNLIEYGCPIGAREMYVSTPYDYFDCTAFLELLNGGIGNGIYVNCSDCASILSTFANILGTNLWQSRMGMYIPAFNTNPILAIGSKRWQTPCGFGLGFMYHEVAWKGDCGPYDGVYDACLEVDADSYPYYPYYIPVLPTNMRFGLAHDGYYRSRLAAPDSQNICTPRPEERRRRALI